MSRWNRLVKTGSNVQMKGSMDKRQSSGWAWPEKHHVAVEEPAGATWALTPSETGVLRWQAITQRLWQGFQQTPVLSGPSPHTSPLTHMLEPYTTMYVSTAIRVIADYIHNCLTQVGQTCINPQLGFLTFGLKEDCSECWRLTNPVPLWNLFLFIDRFYRIYFSVIFTSLPLSQTEQSCEIWLARRHMHKMKTHSKCFRFEACWWISGQCVTDR